MVKQFNYPAGANKPTREQLVQMSNEILYLTQRDCDVHRKSVVYHVAAIHFSVSPEPYERWLLRCTPGATYRNGANGENEDEDDNDSIEKRIAAQSMRHNETMFNLYGASMEGILDRQDRIVERLLDRNDRLETKNEKLMDMLERALDMKVEREVKLEREKLKTRAIEKGLDFALAMAPPLVNQLAGKQVIPTNDTAETIALKNFFKPVEEGGLLTKEQAQAAFGQWDDTPEHNLVVPGVLNRDQVMILVSVANGSTSPDELNKLIPPDGACALTMDQIVSLQQIFSMEQIAPIMLIFEARRNARRQK
jgi:hypothetical protein